MTEGNANAISFVLVVVTASNVVTAKRMVVERNYKWTSILKNI
jgi:hypothetical protein